MNHLLSTMRHQYAVLCCAAEAEYCPHTPQLTSGSVVVRQIVNLIKGCVNAEVCGAGVAREAAQMSRVSCIHVYGDPLKYRDLDLKLEVQRFNSAIVLCDAAWVTLPSPFCTFIILFQLLLGGLDLEKSSPIHLHICHNVSGCMTVCTPSVGGISACSI